jgi:2-polyprenyl-3-methyl-5-hydroxy-6-metoxy-1,4-benzoquinol methylase
MAFVKRIIYNAVFGSRGVRLVPPTQRPYISPSLRRYYERRHTRKIRRARTLAADEYGASVPVGEIEEIIGCTLCGETKQQPLFQPSRGQGDSRWSYRVVRCPGCGFLYRNPNIKPGQLGELYADSYSAFLSGTYAGKRRRKYRLTMDTFDPVFGEGTGRRLLDFGCGNGLFLAEAAKRGFTSYGVDLSSDSVAQARERVPTAQVHLGSPADVPEIATGGFDVITMWSVLAHLPRPVDDLAMLRSLLAPEGVLLIFTVNANSVQLKTFGPRWNGFTTNHLMFYSPFTLPLLLTKAGFAAVAFAPFYGDGVEAGTTRLSPARADRLRRTVDQTQGGNMMRALAFADDAAVKRWGDGLDVRRLDALA